MPNITGSWRAPKGGAWKLTIPVRVTNALTGTEILPAGVYSTGTLTAGDPSTLSVPGFPTSTGTTPSGWKPVLEVSVFDGSTETYYVDVSGTTPIDLGTYVLPGTVPDQPSALVRGVAGGVAALDAAGRVLDGSGAPVAGGGGGAGAVASVNGQTGVVVLAAGDVGAPTTAALTAHTGSTSNPHSTTKSQVGLGNVDNTSDANKPVSTATANALNAKADLVGGLVPTSQIPALALTTGQAVTSRAAMLALTNVQPGDLAVITTGADKGSYVLQAADPSVFGNWLLLNAPTDVVQSVNGMQGTVVLGYGDVGAASAAQGVKADAAATATALATEVTRAQAAESSNATAISNNTTAVNGRVPQTRQVTAGYGLSGGGDLTADRTLTAGLTVVTAQLSVDAPTPAATQTDILTVTLGVGAWLVSGTMTIQASTTINVDVIVLLGTAAGSITGTAASSGRTATTFPLNMSLDALVTVTTAGTVKFALMPSSGGTATAKAVTNLSGASPATGIVAVRVA